MAFIINDRISFNVKESVAGMGRGITLDWTNKRDGKGIRVKREKNAMVQRG
jgi:hypothetical protein